jgi:hypothetical protein
MRGERRRNEKKKPSTCGTRQVEIGRDRRERKRETKQALHTHYTTHTKWREEGRLLLSLYFSCVPFLSPSLSFLSFLLFFFVPERERRLGRKKTKRGRERERRRGVIGSGDRKKRRI